jgi:hypothetical protein
MLHAFTGAKMGLLEDELLLQENSYSCNFGPNINSTRISWSSFSSHGISPVISFRILKISEGFPEASMKSPPTKLH